MNRLEVFNKVEAHLLAQGAKSMNASTGLSGACAYRGEGGMSCAIGCLIKDEFYHKGLEGLGMWSDNLHMRTVQSRLRDALTASGITDINSRETRMLFDLQRLHDTVEPEEWKQELQNLRVKYFGIDTSNTCDEKAAIDRHNNQWVGLTHEEKLYLNDVLNLQGRFPIIEAIEAKLKYKNSERQKGE